MKRGVVALLVMTTMAPLVGAGNISVGGQTLSVPEPVGFICVTPEMDAVYRLSGQISRAKTDVVAYYIPESYAAIALGGAMPPLERTFNVQVTKTLGRMSVGRGDFSALKALIKHQNLQVMESVKSEMPELLDNLSKGISEEFDVDVAVGELQMIPLDPHYEVEHAMAYSMYINCEVASGAVQQGTTGAATGTLVNVAGKVLFLYCNAPKAELEWTRRASRAWTEAILASNPPPPEEAGGECRVNWQEVLGRAVAGAIVGGVMAMIGGVVAFFKRRGRSG